MTVEYTLAEIDLIAERLLREFSTAKCFAFYAEMGCGKTTLIKALCCQLGVKENTSSPTFSIINEYRGAGDIRVFHSDWYRLKGVQEAIDAGIEDMLCQQDAFRFVEWPEIAEELLPPHHIRVTINLMDEQQRVLTAKLYEEQEC